MTKTTKRKKNDESSHRDKRVKAAVARTLDAASPSPSIRVEFSSDSVCAAARVSIKELSIDVDEILAGSRVLFLTDDKTSWVFHVPGWYKRLYGALQPHELSYHEWIDAVWALHPPHQDAIKMFGKDVLMPRFQQVYGQNYRFSGRLFEAQPFPDLLKHALQAMQRLVVQPETQETYLHAVLVNWYEHGEHYIGPHTDDESNIHRYSPVLSLSLGASRRFVFTRRQSSFKTMSVSRGVDRLEILLHDGDLLVMGGTTQKTHKHALPKMKQCTDKRISLTLRCFH